MSRFRDATNRMLKHSRESFGEALVYTIPGDPSHLPEAIPDVTFDFAAILDRDALCKGIDADGIPFEGIQPRLHVVLADLRLDDGTLVTPKHEHRVSTPDGAEVYDIQRVESDMPGAVNCWLITYTPPAPPPEEPGGDA